MRAASPSCPPESALSDFALAKLDAASANAVCQHLDVCVSCRDRVANLSVDSFVDRLREANAAGTVADKLHPPFVLGESTGHSAADLETPPADSRLEPAQSVDGSLPGETSSDVAPPELLKNPDFEVLGKLGQGPMGTVYLARNRLMHRLEALKVVDPALLRRAGASEQLRLAIGAAASLNHPHIVATYRLIRPGGLLALAMEHVDGTDLARLVERRGALPAASATYYVHQAARGLEHAFQKGMVHHDIRPGNLTLAIEGEKHVVKIVDFGLAKAIRGVGEDTKAPNSGPLLGDPDYAAPEQMDGTRQADIRADIYSLGCTLYFLLSGQPPFRGQRWREGSQTRQTRMARPLNEIRAEIPAELAAVAAKMTAQDPAQRYQTPSEVAEALEPFFNIGASGAGDSPTPMPIVAAAPSSQPPAVPPARGSGSKAQRLLWHGTVAGAAALLVLLAGMILLVGSDDRDKFAPAVETAGAVGGEEPLPEPSVAPLKPTVADGDSTRAPANGSRGIDLDELKSRGAFGFPQQRAQVLCDNGDLRVSLWNNHEYLYVQAIVWKDHADDTGPYSSDMSILTLVGADDLSITPNVDRRYHLSTINGFGHSVKTAISERFEGGTGGRGAIRYLDLGDGQPVRLDCLLVPLQEVKKQSGDRLGIGFKAISFDPFVQYESQAGSGLHAVTLADDRESLDPKDVTRGWQPGPSAPESGLLEPIADFLFNGNGRDEVSDASIVKLKNVEYRDDALYINGLHELNAGGREATVYLQTDFMELREFTVALRFKAAEFDAEHDTLLGMEFPNFFRLFRSPQGNLRVSLGQDKYSHEFAGSPIDADRWTTVACGVDLEAGKCIAYLNGALAGESDIPHELQLRNIGPTRHKWTFGDCSRGPVYHGLVDELMIYDKLLSPDEFAKIPLRVDSTSPRVSRHPRTASAEALAEAAANEAAAKNDGVTAKLSARFLCNGNGADELQQLNLSSLQNVEFRDGALYLKGQLFPGEGGQVDSVTLTSRALDLNHFTVAMRFRADDFDDKHNYLLGTPFPSAWFRLRRLRSGNLAFHLGGDQFYREAPAARLEPGRWTVVACGADLNVGKAVVYFNGALAGEFEIPRTLERWKLEEYQKIPIQFWQFQYLDQKFRGLVDELLVYDQLLTHEEFEQIPLRVGAATAEPDE